MIRAALLVVLAACGSTETEAAPGGGGKEVAAHPPKAKLAASTQDLMCATKGAVALGARVTEATTRAIVRGSRGDAASMTFTYRGDSEKVRALAGGQERRQLGLKLRAENGCNLVYVMWRLDPKVAIDVSVKANPGKRTHKECGADGYTKVKPTKAARKLVVPALIPDERHTLRAEIEGDELHVWIDDHAVWRGVLPAAARKLQGPAGLRSDNVQFDLEAFETPPADVATATLPKCVVEEGD